MLVTPPPPPTDPCYAPECMEALKSDVNGVNDWISVMILSVREENCEELRATGAQVGATIATGSHRT